LKSFQTPGVKRISGIGFGIQGLQVEMMFTHAELKAALQLGLDASDMTHQAMAENLQLEEAVSDKRRVLFEEELMSKGVST
jgi:hypothetical protein